MQIDVIKRENPVKINIGHDFSSPKRIFSANASPGEEFAFQIAVLAENEIENLAIAFTDLSGESGEISESDFFCINFGGIDYKGQPFLKKLSLKSGEQQILWVSVKIPENASGEYKGKIFVVGDEQAQIELNLTVEGEKAVNHGHNTPALFTRLSWLNSTLGIDKNPTKDYFSPEMSGDEISILGRKISVSETGFPKKIISKFDKNLKISENENLITDEIKLNIKKDGKDIKFDKNAINFSSDKEGVSWKTEGNTSVISKQVEGRIEFDGYVSLNVKLTANQDCDIDDISIEIPFKSEFSTYAMGLGLKGGYTPETHEFKWDETKHQNAIWIGGINGGLRCEFKGEDFVEPFVNIYYRHRPYKMTKSFYNDGKGGINLNNGILTAFSGCRKMEKGEVLDFSFDLLITPLKELNPKKRFNTRYYHRGDSSNSNVSEALSVGANYMNIHHAGNFNPYINHPFVFNKELKALIDEAHEAGIKLKIYYTIREQSDQTSELQALRSLNEEIFPTPKGGQGSILWDKKGLDWFAENIGSDVIPAWRSEFDAAIISDGCSRMCNYYIEGLDWLLKNQEIDGIYIDDVAYDRITARRTRKILDQKDGCLVDLHSWNHFCDWAGYGNSLNIYMKLLPYIDSIWIGEGFDHDAGTEDFWVVEIMGLPFGMSGELLPESADSQYRGMLFGATTRHPWAGNSPKYLWKFIAENNLAETELLGFWNEETPVKTSEKDVKATLYKGENRLVIAIASWADCEKEITIDLNVEGFSIENAKIPKIESFQEEQEFNGKISIDKCKGLLLVIEK